MSTNEAAPSNIDLPVGTWELDPASTTVTVTARKLGAFTIPATLTITSGRIDVSDGRVTGIEVVADAASYTSKNAKRNAHISSDDFLDAAHHPEIRLHADAATPAGAGFDVAGTVEIKGVGSPIAFSVHDVTIDGDRATFAATATVDRTAVGLGKLPSFVIARNVEFEVAATAVSR